MNARGLGTLIDLEKGLNGSPNSTLSSVCSRKTIVFFARFDERWRGAIARKKREAMLKPTMNRLRLIAKGRALHLLKCSRVGFEDDENLYKV